MEAMLREENTGDVFAGAGKHLQETFLSCLFFKKSKSFSSFIGTLSTITANKSGLGLQNPVTSANEKYLSLQCASMELIRYVTGEGEFSNTDQLLALREERRDEKKYGMASMTPNSRN